MKNAEQVGCKTSDKKTFANGDDVVEGLFSLMSLRAKYICIFSKDILSK